MERQTMLCLTKHVLNFRGYCRIKREFKVKKDMDRRDFLKTLAVTGAAMTIQRIEAMDILTQTLTNTGDNKVDLVAVMGGEPEVSPCHYRTGWYEKFHQTGTESSNKT